MIVITLVIDFEPPFDSQEAEKIIIGIFSSDGGEDLRRTLAPSGEPRHPMMVTGEDDLPISVYESWQLNLEKYKIQDAWLKAWNASAKLSSTGQPIDGLILPPCAHVAHKHGKWPK